MDDKLMKKAPRASGVSTRREVVEPELSTLVRLSEQAEIRNWRGKLRWDGDLDAMRTDRKDAQSAGSGHR